MLIVISAFLMIFLVIVIYNYFTAPVFRKNPGKNSSLPLVSVLIPARNEEKNISKCLAAIVNQEYPSIEIIAGNDNSSDRTGELISEYSEKHSNVTKIEIPALPEGWKGKSFVLHTLEKAAEGSKILFVDADVILSPGAVSSAVEYMRKYNADILTVFPRQLTYASEKLVVPLLNLFLLTLLPLRQVYESRRVSLSAGIGQFMMFTREAYKKIGGHYAVKDKVVEDIELVRIAKQKNSKVLAMLDGGLAACRMYNGFKDALDGFTKNFFKGTTLPSPVFLMLLTVYFLVFFIPVIMIFFNSAYLFPLLIVILIRLVISLMSRQSVINVLLHPVQMLIFYTVGIRSLFYGDKVRWKGRDI